MGGQARGRAGEGAGGQEAGRATPWASCLAGTWRVASAHCLLQRSFMPGSADFQMSVGFLFCP